MGRSLPIYYPLPQTCRFCRRKLATRATFALCLIFRALSFSSSFSHWFFLPFSLIFPYIAAPPPPLLILANFARLLPLSFIQQPCFIFSFYFSILFLSPSSFILPYFDVFFLLLSSSSCPNFPHPFFMLQLS